MRLPNPPLAFFDLARTERTHFIQPAICIGVRVMRFIIVSGCQFGFECPFYILIRVLLRRPLGRFSSCLRCCDGHHVHFAKRESPPAAYWFGDSGAQTKPAFCRSLRNPRRMRRKPHHQLCWTVGLPLVLKQHAKEATGNKCVCTADKQRFSFMSE